MTKIDMTKLESFANKERSWDENIWRLIVFAITIIIAVWVLGILAYFYQEHQEEAAVMSVLGSSSSDLTDLEDAGFLHEQDDGEDAWIEYNAIADEYTMWTDDDSATLCDEQDGDDCEIGIEDFATVDEDGDCDDSVEDCVVYELDH